MSTTPKSKRTTHTPGPWRIATELYSHATGVICVEHPTFDAIDVLIQGWPESFQEHNANACLIAAAPDLLGAAKDALRTLTEADEIESDKRQSRRLLEVAIAKAEGK